MPNYEIVRDAMASLVQKMLLTKLDQDWTSEEREKLLPQHRWFWIE
jgi:hypothetical protein